LWQAAARHKAKCGMNLCAACNEYNKPYSVVHMYGLSSDAYNRQHR